MQIKKAYGELSSEDFNLGDIVEWRVWDSDGSEWLSNYGVITNIKGKIVSNRLVYTCTVLPMDDSRTEKELFCMSLKLISKANENNDSKLDC
jgi:hypothetical protein